MKNKVFTVFASSSIWKVKYCVSDLLVSFYDE